jgi:hypothetical protein
LHPFIHSPLHPFTPLPLQSFTPSIIHPFVPSPLHPFTASPLVTSSHQPLKTLHPLSLYHSSLRPVIPSQFTFFILFISNPSTLRPFIPLPFTIPPSLYRAMGVLWTISPKRPISPNGGTSESKPLDWRNSETCFASSARNAVCKKS